MEHARANRLFAQIPIDLLPFDNLHDAQLSHGQLVVVSFHGLLQSRQQAGHTRLILFSEAHRTRAFVLLDLFIVLSPYI